MQSLTIIDVLRATLILVHNQKQIMTNEMVISQVDNDLYNKVLNFDEREI